MNGIIPRIEVGALGGHPYFFFPFFFLCCCMIMSVLLGVSTLRGCHLLASFPPHRLQHWGGHPVVFPIFEYL